MKQKIIIVEGVDKIGKTTLCKTLSEHLKIKIYQRPSDEFDFSKLTCGGVSIETCKLLSYLRKTKQSIIFDRLHFSEYVYGKLDRHYDEMDNLCWFDATEAFLQGLDVTLISCKISNLDFTISAHKKDVRPYDELFSKLAERTRIKKKVEYQISNWDDDYKNVRECIEKDEIVC